MSLGGRRIKGVERVLSHAGTPRCVPSQRRSFARYQDRESVVYDAAATASPIEMAPPAMTST